MTFLSPVTTTSCFSSLIYLESFFSINRSYLISDRRTRIFWNTMSILIFFSITVVIFNNVFKVEVKLSDKIFQGFLAAEFLILVLAARYRNVSFSAFDRLDEKCGVEKKVLDELQKNVKKQLIISIASIAIDVAGMATLKTKIGDLFVYLVMFAAREAETIFFALIIEAMNLRLMKLNSASPGFGSKVYRHILIASSQMNEEFTPRILINLGVILVTTVCYSCTIMLLFSMMGIKLAVYLLWRELKTMYCVWKLCYAASRSEKLCQQLAFQLARKLAFDPALDKAKHPQVYSVVHRWYTMVLRHRPRYVRGYVLFIGLSIPLHLVDISINYVLIIIQIYMAYK